VVWFEEQVLDYEIAKSHIKEARRVLVVGTHLSVYPVAGLLKQAPYRAEKVIVTLAVESKPKGYRLLRANAEHMVPYCKLLAGGAESSTASALKAAILEHSRHKALFVCVSMLLIKLKFWRNEL